MSESDYQTIVTKKLDKIVENNLEKSLVSLLKFYSDLKNDKIKSQKQKDIEINNFIKSIIKPIVDELDQKQDIIKNNINIINNYKNIFELGNVKFTTIQKQLSLTLTNPDPENLIKIGDIKYNELFQRFFLILNYKKKNIDNIQNIEDIKQFIKDKIQDVDINNNIKDELPFVKYWQLIAAILYELGENKMNFNFLKSLENVKKLDTEKFLFPKPKEDKKKQNKQKKKGGAKKDGKDSKNKSFQQNSQQQSFDKKLEGLKKIYQNIYTNEKKSENLWDFLNTKIKKFISSKNFDELVSNDKLLFKNPFNDKKEIKIQSFFKDYDSKIITKIININISDTNILKEEKQIQIKQQNEYKIKVFNIFKDKFNLYGLNEIKNITNDELISIRENFFTLLIHYYETTYKNLELLKKRLEDLFGTKIDQIEQQNEEDIIKQKKIENKLVQNITQSYTKNNKITNKKQAIDLRKERIKLILNKYPEDSDEYRRIIKILKKRKIHVK